MKNKLITQKIQDAFSELEISFEEERAAIFNSLTNEEQLAVFCEVVYRLTQAELVDRRSYRGILYEVFGFGQESYALAQLSGFLELHNSIDADRINLNEFGSRLLQLYGIEQTPEEVEKKIRGEYDVSNEN